MVNFIINNTNPYELSSSVKKYDYDQDKAQHPTITYSNTLKLLKKTHPDKKFILKEFFSNKCFSIYNFSDGFYSQRGKGATKDQAKASAIMEFVERFSWLNFDYKNAPGYTQQSFNDLSVITDLSNIERALDIYYSPQKEELANLAKTIPIDWVHAYSLVHNKTCYYPISWNNINQSSNGLACGNTKEETIVQGICELIERHNLSIFILKYKEINYSVINHDSITHPVIKDMLAYYKSKNIKILIINASFPLEVPMIIACGLDPHTNKEIAKTGYGFGCHTDPSKAIIRAISEYAQGREILLENKEISDDFDYKEGQWQTRLNIDIDHIQKHADKIPISALKNLSNTDFNLEIEKLILIFKKMDYDLLIINKTHPKLNIPVYRIYCPDLYGIKEMHSLGRSEFFMIVQIFYQAKMYTEAKEYYEKHFKHIINSFENMFPVIDHFLNKSLKENNKFDLLHKVVNMDIIKTMLTPDKVPYDKACSGNYIEGLKSTNHIMKDYDKMNKQL